MAVAELSQSPNCVMCHYEKSHAPHFAEYGKDRLDHFVVAESDHFKVKPDILPAHPDGLHLLLHPKHHTFNYAEMHAFAQEIGGLLHGLEYQFGPMAIFEHGGTKEGGKNQSVYHAHSHLVGGLENFDVIAYMEYMLSGGLGPDEVYPYKIVPAPDYAFLVNLKARYNGHPYLYVEQGPWALFSEDQDDRMVSQITQRSLHEHFSGPELGRILNWKNIPTSEFSAMESVKRLAALIDKCNAKLK